jgi:hypothetical protein
VHEKRMDRNRGNYRDRELLSGTVSVMEPSD